MHEIQIDQGPERAIIVGVITPDTNAQDVDDALNELELLADTAGAVVTDRVTQSLRQINAATYVGRGKVDEIKALVEHRESDLVIFDADLSTVQIRNLERSFDCKLLDRTGLILDIFASGARTAIAKTQVELAQLDYMRTRLTRQWTHLSRQSGGIGTKGPGETQIETDRRLIADRMSYLKTRLEKIDRQRQTQRKGRDAYSRVSLVGYTNAGKSTLMNAVAGTDVRAENRLFATLDATTRTVELDGNKQILLSDTVGFIRKLPHRLIESFKSTLDEVREADILLHVVDVSHPNYEDQIVVVNKTLQELGAFEKPILTIFNKMDLYVKNNIDEWLEESTKKEILNDLMERWQGLTGGNAIFVSAIERTNIEELRDVILQKVRELYRVRYPYKTDFFY